MKIQLIILFGFLAGFTRRIYTCLTWNIDGTSLELTCRLHDFVQEVYIINPNKEKLAACTFEEEIANCVSYQNHGRITSDFTQIKVVLTLDNIRNYVNGEWTCVQGTNKFKTVVTTVRGIISATALSFVGQYMDPDKVKLTCSSCREPHRNYVEFLIDGRSVDSISYDHDTRQCKRGNENCTLDVCSCSPSGNEFTRVFIINNDTKWQNFTCEMRFMDRSQLYRFLKKSTLEFNGSAFKSISNETRKTKEPERVFVPSIEINDTLNTSTSTRILVTTTEKTSIEERDDRDKIVWVVVVVLVIIAAGAGTVLFCKIYRSVKNAEYQEKEGQITEEESKQINEGAISCKDESSPFIPRLHSAMDETRVIFSPAESIPSIEAEAISLRDESSPLIVTDERKDLLQKPLSKSTHQSYCEPCFAHFKKTVAEYWCVECSERLCHQCKVHHSYMKICRGHTLIPVHEVPPNYSLSLVVICKEHDDKNKEYICTDHDDLCCKECIDAIHSSCKTMLLLLYDTESNLTKLVEQQTIKIKQILQLLKETKQECFQLKEVYEVEASGIEKSIEKEIDSLNVKENSRSLRKESMGFQMLKELKRLRTAMISKTEQDITFIEKSIVHVNELQTFIDFTTRRCSKMQLLILLHSKIKPALRDVNDHIQHIINTKQELDCNLEITQQHQMQVAVDVEKSPTAIGKHLKGKESVD